MPTTEVDEFAEKLMTLVRDLSIQACDRRLRPEAKNLKSLRWKAAMARGPEDLARVIIPDCVDTTIFYLLHAIDNGMGVLYRASNDNVVDLQDVGYGELAGWNGGPDGWQARFSKERYQFDPIAANYP